MAKAIGGIGDLPIRPTLSASTLSEDVHLCSDKTRYLGQLSQETFYIKEYSRDTVPILLTFPFPVTSNY